MSDPEADRGPARERGGVELDRRIEPTDFSGPDGPELVAEIGHTLQSRLASILFLAESLHTSLAEENDDARRHQVGLLYGSALTASVFAGNIMELARGGGDLIGHEPEPVSVSAMLRATYDAVRPVAEERGITIERSPSEPDERPAHPMALQRILLGLAVAALEFTDRGVLIFAARATRPTRTEFSIHAPTATVDADERATLDQPIRPREHRDGWHWSPTGVAVATARQLLEKTGAELTIQTDAEHGLRFLFETGSSDSP